MRNIKSSFERTGEISREVSNRSDWLEDFAEKLAVQEQVSKTSEKQIKTARHATAVEVARERQQAQPSIYEMMSAIISDKKPKYSSVEEAVKDYQDRTGLAQYLKANSKDNLKEMAFQVAQAAEKCEECDNDNAEDHISAAHRRLVESMKAGNIKNAVENLDLLITQVEPFGPSEEEILKDLLEDYGDEFKPVMEAYKEDGSDAKDEKDDEDEEDDKWAEVIQLFQGDDDDPGPGGAGGEATLFEIPEVDELEEAATSDGNSDYTPTTMASYFESLISEAESKKKVR